MGISYIPASFLARNSHHVANAKNGIILGRQTLNMRGHRLSRFCRNASKYGFNITPDDCVQPDGFTEKILKTLGFPEIEALDFTDKEGADYVHDLNRPVPKSLREKFDIVIDGGTTEHVFHISQALDSCHAMLKPGGVFFSFTVADGWFGHGFFQTGPDVPWRYWHHARGYEMLEVSIAPRENLSVVIPIEDPTGKPRGGERFLSGPHMLLTAARKPLAPPPYRLPIQGHYVK